MYAASVSSVNHNRKRDEEEGGDERQTDLKLATKLSLCGVRTLMSMREPVLLPSEMFSSVVSMSVQPSPLKPQLPVDGWWGRRRGEEEKISLRAGILPSLRRRWERTCLQVTADGDGVGDSLAVQCREEGRIRTRWRR